MIKDWPRLSDERVEPLELRLRTEIRVTLLLNHDVWRSALNSHSVELHRTLRRLPLTILLGARWLCRPQGYVIIRISRLETSWVSSWVIPVTARLRTWLGWFHNWACERPLSYIMITDRILRFFWIELNWIEKCLFEKPQYKYKEDIKTIKAGFSKWTHRSIIHGL